MSNVRHSVKSCRTPGRVYAENRFLYHSAISTLGGRMAKHISFKEQRARVGIEDILIRYGHRDTLTKKGNELRGPCMFHEDTTPSFSANTEKNVFKCFGCKVGGDIYAFVMEKEGIEEGANKRGVRQAALLIDEWFPESRNENADVSIPAMSLDSKAKPSKLAKEKKEKEAEKGEDEPVNAPLSFALQKLDHEHPYLIEERNFLPETTRYFGVGFCESKRGLMAGRIAIPIHNEFGDLVAYAGRWPGNEPPEGEGKYKLPPRFHKSQVVYNLDKAQEYAADGLILVEGFFDVMRLYQAGFPNAVALMGSAMSAEQERLLIAMVGKQGRITLAFDGDEAGQAGSADALSRLVNHIFVRVVDLEGKQPDQVEETELHNLFL